MSTPQAAVLPNVTEATRLLDKRLAPAKLDKSSKTNGAVFNQYLIRVGKASLVRNMPAQELCDELYAAIQNDVNSQFPALVWEVPPKALSRRFEKVKDPNARQDFREVEDLSKRMAESHKADERIKEQEAARKRVLGLISQFCPTKRGVLKYDLRDKMQAEWRKQVSETKDFVSLEFKIRKEQEKLYAQLERPEQV